MVSLQMGYVRFIPHGYQPFPNFRPGTSILGGHTSTFPPGLRNGKWTLQSVKVKGIILEIFSVKKGEEHLHSLKLTPETLIFLGYIQPLEPSQSFLGDILPENEWLEYNHFLLGYPIFRCYVSALEGIWFSQDVWCKSILELSLEP